ncbi:MAG: TOBE domain-containing protein [Candidatus Binatia bacterium]
MQLSARNQFPGTVVHIKKGVVTAEVVVRIAGGHEIVSVITMSSVKALGLKKGAKVTAVVKSTEVMLGVDH